MMMMMMKNKVVSTSQCSPNWKTHLKLSIKPAIVKHEPSLPFNYSRV